VITRKTHHKRGTYNSYESCSISLVIWNSTAHILLGISVGSSLLRLKLLGAIKGFFKNKRLMARRLASLDTVERRKSPCLS
jgi:hypothetical protein